MDEQLKALESAIENAEAEKRAFVKENPDIKFIKAGSIDDSSWINANSNFWSSTAKSWSPVDETLHTFTHNPDFA